VSVGTLTWDIARVGGLMAYILITASVLIGIVLSLKWRSPLWPRLVTNELHRFVTLVGLVFIAVHTIAVALDPFIAFTPAEVLVPLLSHYRPVWVALGIVAAYVALAVYLSERVRGRIGYAWWRRFHTLAFVVFVLATIHGLGTGSDSRTAWAIAMYLGCAGSVVILLALRLAPGRGSAGHPVAAAVLMLLAVEVAIWAFSGPLRPGWNAIANDGRGSGGVTQATQVTQAVPPAPVN